MSARQRWPVGAEQHRLAAVDASAVARDLLRDARQLIRDSQEEIKRNPALKGMMDFQACALIADAAALLADIQLALTEAKFGE